MKKTKGFLIATTMSLAIMGALIVVTMNGCNKPSSTAPILPGNEFLTTTLLVLSASGIFSPLIRLFGAKRHRKQCLIRCVRMPPCSLIPLTIIKSSFLIQRKTWIAPPLW